jgi:hypothetical protein
MLAEMHFSVYAGREEDMQYRPLSKVGLFEAQGLKVMVLCIGIIQVSKNMVHFSNLTYMLRI